MSSIASYIARRLSTSVTDRPTVASVEQGQQAGSSPVVANGSSETGPEQQRHTSHTSSEGNKDIPRRPSSTSSAISITEEESKPATIPSVNLTPGIESSNPHSNNSNTPQQQTQQQNLRQQQFPNNDILLSESIRRMAAPRDIAGGLTQSFANHLSLSASPTSTFHSPSGSYGGARPRMDHRQPSKQLKPFATGDIKILLLENVNQTARDILTKQGYQVEFHKSSLPEEQLIEKIRDVHAVGIRSKTKLTAKVLKEAKNLLVIGCFCIGTNQVDLDYAAKHGVAVFNSPFSNSRSVAELVIAEIIALARQLGDRSMELHSGIWNKVSSKCWEIRGKTLGIVGYGHIGSQLSVLAEAMGMSVIFYDVVPLMALGSAKQVSSLDDLLSHADFVTVHVPELPETMNMIKAEQFSKMKNGSYLINASRGSVIDIPALIDAMRSGRIAGAALDVYPNEPAANGQYFTNDLNRWAEDLRGLKNLILTPHIGGSTEEAQSAIGIEVGDALVRYINEGSTIGAVNFPEVTLRSIALSQENHVRVIFIHQNRPGVLRQVNSILGDHNVDKQTSDSRGDVAYLMADVSDVSSNEIKSLYESLESLSSRVMTRLLY